MTTTSKGFVMIYSPTPGVWPSVMSLENFLLLWEDAYRANPERWSAPPTGDERDKWLGRPLAPGDSLSEPAPADLRVYDLPNPEKSCFPLITGKSDGQNLS